MEVCVRSKRSRVRAPLWTVPLLCSLLGLLNCAGDKGPPAPARAVLHSADPSALHVGGTGALTPLMMRLAKPWSSRAGALPLVVEDSIGSGGGVRAAADGLLDLGLLSRPLSEEERRLGLVVIPLGRDAVGVMVHSSVKVDGISSAELLALYQGRQRTFADGTPATPLLRDRSESANAAIEQVVPGLKATRQLAYQDRRLRVLYHDRAMAEAIAATPGAFGVFPLGALLAFELPFKPLAIDGVAPSVTSLESGAWRASRQLLLVTRPDRLPRVTPFLDFLRSEEGTQLARKFGYLPLSTVSK